jgi:hypothetical protein
MITSATTAPGGGSISGDVAAKSGVADDCRTVAASGPEMRRPRSSSRSG